MRGQLSLLCTGTHSPGSRDWKRGDRGHQGQEVASGEPPGDCLGDLRRAEGRSGTEQWSQLHHPETLLKTDSHTLKKWASFGVSFGEIHLPQPLTEARDVAMLGSCASGLSAPDQTRRCRVWGSPGIPRAPNP